MKIPMIEVTDVRTYPRSLIGVMSPKPTVVSVIVDQ